MLYHALSIVANELNDHLQLYPQHSGDTSHVVLGNLAEGWGQNPENVPRGKLNVSVVNIKEEKTLKNLPNTVRNDAKLTVTYENPPVFLNFQILVSATHHHYSHALVMLSRAIRFFQYRNVFTQDNVAPASLIYSGSEMDQLSEFKLIFDLYSPTTEELNYLWGTLGGKQLPSVIYIMRLLDLKYKAVQSERGVITEIVRDFYNTSSAKN